MRVERYKESSVRYQRLREEFPVFSAVSGYSRFFKPEQAKFERQLNPKFQSDFVFPDRAS